MSYQQMSARPVGGVNGGVVGNATPEDVQFVRSKMEVAGCSERLLGVWVPDEKTVKTVAYSGTYSILFCPLMWPLLPGLPCLVGCAMHAKTVYSNTLYFMTTDGFGSVIKEFEPMACCSHPGQDYKYNSWDSVLSLNVDNRASSAFCAQSSVKINMQGLNFNGGSRPMQNCEVWLVANPDDVSGQLRRVWQAARKGQTAGLMA